MDLSLTEQRHRKHLRSLRERVESGLEALVKEDETPENLYAPARYALQSGGKRVRPILLLLGAELFGASPERALPGALAVEIFHNFTLVHDDIMDASEERRGQPTVHRKWDRSTGVLSGDLLMGLAYEQLDRIETDRDREIRARFHWMVRRLCEGQAMDERFPESGSRPVEVYVDLIERKTGALLETALEIGGLIGGAGSIERKTLRSLGRRLGRGFQIQDDLLDVTADRERWGKPIGTDLVEGKRTYLLLRTLELAEGEAHAWFTRILEEGGCAADEIPKARRLMDEIGVLEETRRRVLSEYEAAEESVDLLPEGSVRDVLADLVRVLAARVR